MAFDNISSQIFLVQITLSFEKEMSDATFALAQFWRSYLVEDKILPFLFYPKIQEYE